MLSAWCLICTEIPTFVIIITDHHLILINKSYNSFFFYQSLTLENDSMVCLVFLSDSFSARSSDRSDRLVSYLVTTDLCVQETHLSSSGIPL